MIINSWWTGLILCYSPSRFAVKQPAIHIHNLGQSVAEDRAQQRPDGAVNAHVGILTRKLRLARALGKCELFKLFRATTSDAGIEIAFHGLVVVGGRP